MEATPYGRWMRFDGKVLFTTGAGSGLAEAVARRFSAEGGRVAVVDLAAERAEAVAAELDGSIAIGCDVADEQAVADAVARTNAELGRVDCAFNAAGIADFGPIEEWSLERWNRMLGVHLGGTFLVCKNVLPIMRGLGGGSIVNVASIAAITAQPFNTPYGAAKAGITGFTRQLAREAAPTVRVNCVAPGRIKTGMTIPLYTERGGGDFEKGAAQAAELNLLGRLGEPRDIADPVCFLFSDEASFVTGQTIVPDGGETIL
jgi:3-oxoacyl-[acyl-carrier protein] reductase